MSESDDGLSQKERRELSRPFDKTILARARAIAEQYKLTIESDPEVGFVGSTVELPLVLGGGKTVQACARDVLDATTATIASILERGERPPAPARESKRDQQVNIRLSADEKFRLEEAARREGFRSVSDFIRAASLGRAG